MTDRQPWDCYMCGSRGTTRPEVVVVFHRCEPPERSLRVLRLPEPHWPNREEARAAIWAGIAEAMDALPDRKVRR
jgi:hypothetical protein